MIVIKMKGRLGNQLFQYAFAKKLSYIFNDEIYIDWSLVEDRHSGDNDGWCDSLKDFKTCYEKIVSAPLDSTQRYLLRMTTCIEKVQRQITKFTKKHYEIPSYWAKILSYYGIFYRLNGYQEFHYSCRRQTKFVYGYYETLKYFEDVDNLIKEEFQPKYPLLEHNHELYNLICSTESICVSIRRGDFFTSQNEKAYGVCTKDYYYEGIKKIREVYPDSIVVVFSDDVKWTQENLHIPGKVYYETGDDPLWEKLRLMYSCKHFVISNSTFSWWAQHLADNKNKIVVAPKVWRRDGKKNDIYEDNWTIL